MAEKRKKVDWAAVKLDYEAGVLTDREIGKKHGCSHTAVGKKAKAGGWTRNLKDRIRAKAAEKVAKSVVATKVSSKGGSGNLATEKQTVEANAQLQADIILKHRTDISRTREICRGLIEELGMHSLTEQQRLDIVAMIAQVNKDSDPKQVKGLVDAFFKSLDLNGRADTMRKLAASLDTLVKLERVAFGIVDEAKPQDAYENALRELASAG